MWCRNYFRTWDEAMPLVPAKCSVSPIGCCSLGNVPFEEGKANSIYHGKKLHLTLYAKPRSARRFTPPGALHALQKGQPVAPAQRFTSPAGVGAASSVQQKTSQQRTGPAWPKECPDVRMVAGCAFGDGDVFAVLGVFISHGCGRMVLAVLIT